MGYHYTKQFKRLNEFEQLEFETRFQAFIGAAAGTTSMDNMPAVRYKK